MIVLDTNVLSEMIRRDVDPAVRNWLADQDEAVLATTCINEAELWAGIALLPNGRRRESLARSVLAIFQSGFGAGVLPFDHHAATKYGEVVAGRRRAGRRFGEFDTLIAAIAAAHGAAVATSDTDGFMGCGLMLVDPWTGLVTG